MSGTTEAYKGARAPWDEEAVIRCEAGCTSLATHRGTFYSANGHTSLDRYYCEAHAKWVVTSTDPPRRIVALSEWTAFVNRRDQRNLKARRKAYEETHVRMGDDWGLPA